ncbi:MAG: type 4a pilus biogenesis protein PilO [Gammaproteobacteria bacterium]
MIDLLVQVRPAMLGVLVTALFGLTGVAGHLYAFKRPLAERQQLRAELADLGADEDAASLQQRLDALRAERAAYAASLRDAAPAVPAGNMVAYLIGELDRRARPRELRLLQVSPAVPAIIGGFEEMSYVVEVEGRYGALHDWLSAVESELRRVAVKAVVIEPLPATDGERRLTLTLAAYRAEET